MSYLLNVLIMKMIRYMKTSLLQLYVDSGDTVEEFMYNAIGMFLLKNAMIAL